MRGFFNGIKEQGRQDQQMRASRGTSDVTPGWSEQGGTGPATIFSSVARDLFLFCLTGGAIFDNRAGLLKQIDSERAAEPCQPLGHKSKC